MCCCAHRLSDAAQTVSTQRCSTNCVHAAMQHKLCPRSDATQIVSTQRCNTNCVHTAPPGFQVKAVLKPLELHTSTLLWLAVKLSQCIHVCITALFIQLSKKASLATHTDIYSHTLFCNKMAFLLTGVYQYGYTWTRDFRDDGSAEKDHTLGHLVPPT